MRSYLPPVLVSHHIALAPCTLPSSYVARLKVTVLHKTTLLGIMLDGIVLFAQPLNCGKQERMVNRSATE